MRVRFVLQGNDGSLEVENLPERDAEVQKADAAHRAAHPTGSDHSLQTLNTRLARSIQQKIVVAPIADSPHSVRPPGRNREKDADFEAEDDVENNA